MVLTLPNGKRIDLTQGIDISIPLTNDVQNPRAWYMDVPRIEPVREKGWVGSVKEGGSVNFRNIYFNPHGHTTHTECLGHITEKVYSVNKVLNQYFFEAVLFSVQPNKKYTPEGEDEVIEPEHLEGLRKYRKIDALVIRTLPNPAEKKSKNYSSTNPPFISADCLKLINQLEVKHLLIDLPSVDKEIDGGVLAFHHGFWEVPERPRHDRTITELVYIPDTVSDGEYLLNLQVASFENDAAPSRPVLFKVF
ncbi:MAG: cyclase family protein [Brumimicrobium sp.]|nr:cyclase family protein [Brumimicrobium sp.]